MLMRITRIRWDEQSIQHVAGHKVELDEVESAVFGRRYERRGREENRYEIYGQTDEGRYLFIVLDHEGRGIFYVVTARDMEPSEKRLYRRVTRK